LQVLALVGDLFVDRIRIDRDLFVDRIRIDRAQVMALVGDLFNVHG
jgi:hypothetical protein